MSRLAKRGGTADVCAPIGRDEMSKESASNSTIEVPLKHAAEYEKLGALPMSKGFTETDPHLSFLQKPHTLTLLFAALALLCYVGFTRDVTSSPANIKLYVQISETNSSHAPPLYFPPLLNTCMSLTQALQERSNASRPIFGPLRAPTQLPLDPTHTYLTP